MRYALRGLANSPGFTTVAILSLALGIGANTAIFSLINAVVLKSLPVSHPEELVQLMSGRTSYGAFTNPMWEQLRDHQDIFSGAFAFGHMGFHLGEGGDARQAHGRWVSGEFFTTLGVHAALGRTILPGDDRRGCAGVAALSHAFWRREYGGDAAAIGRNITLDGHAFTIVGVVDPGFTGVEVGDPGEIFVPLCSEATIHGATSSLDQRTHWWLYVMARPKPGVTIERVRARLQVLAPAVLNATLPANYAAKDAQEYLRFHFDARPMPGGLSGLRNKYRDTLMILIAATGLVLLIACSNVANLLLARASMRSQEMAVRAALGAGRMRIVREALTESLLLSCAGTSLGALVAVWAAKALVATLGTPDSPVFLDLAPDWRMLAFTAGVAIASALIFGLAPAWRMAGVSPMIAMKAGGRSATEGSSQMRLGKALVALQIALSFVLLSGAGLLAGTFRNLATLDPGFRAEGVTIMYLESPIARYSATQATAAKREILERLRLAPGVRAASASSHSPIVSGSYGTDLIIQDHEVEANFNRVSEGFFETIGTPIRAGRDFTPRDTLVAIINDTAAKKFFPGDNPLGQTLHLRDGKKIGPAVEIVGIAGDVKYLNLRVPAPPTVYMPANQDSDSPAAYFQVRAVGPAAARSVMSTFDPRIPVTFTPFTQIVSESLSRERLLAALGGIFSGLALLLAGIGLYGVLSYNVARRRNEIGIRMALGATRPIVLRMVLRESALLSATGLAAGLIAALAAGRAVAAFLYGLSPNDGLTLGGAAAMLTSVAMLAAYLPARRAARSDPMSALRDE